MNTIKPRHTTLNPIARTLGRKLRLLDDREFSLLLQGKDADLDAYAARRKELVKEALAKNLKIVEVPVADGYALFYEARRARSQSTFRWFYGGPDNYVPAYGRTLTVPAQKADQMIKDFNPDHL